jgi:hypothetical protein
VATQLKKLPLFLMSLKLVSSGEQKTVNNPHISRLTSP